MQATISNDGAKILQLLDVVHPAARTLVDIARAQDAEIGDGTTTVTLLAAELLRQAKPFVEDGVHPQIIVRVSVLTRTSDTSVSIHIWAQGYRAACVEAIKQLREIAVSVAESDSKGRRALLEKCAKTSLNSKLIAQYQVRVLCARTTHGNHTRTSVYTCVHGVCIQVVHTLRPRS